MACRIGFLILFILISEGTTAPLKNHLVRFYPISRAQYESILRMTSGQPVISEGRLINSSFRTLNNLRTAISSDLSSSWHQLLNITGLRSPSNKPSNYKVDGYPLCVIKTNDWEEHDQGDNIDQNLEQERRNNGDGVGRDEDNEEYVDNTEHERPIVNCIVVVKKPDEAETHPKPPPPVQPELTPQRSQFVPLRPVVNARLNTPYYYPPYTYPAYPYYGYPYYPEARHTKTQVTRNSTPKRVTFADLARSSASDSISAETAAPMPDKSVGRSGYSSYYPGYGGYAGYGSTSSYSQGYPYSAGYGSYGGCQQSYNPYGNQGYYGGGGGYFTREGSNDSSEDTDSDFSGEVGGEIGGEEFK